MTSVLVPPRSTPMRKPAILPPSPSAFRFGRAALVEPIALVLVPGPLAFPDLFPDGREDVLIERLALDQQELAVLPGVAELLALRQDAAVVMQHGPLGLRQIACGDAVVLRGQRSRHLREDRAIALRCVGPAHE